MVSVAAVAQNTRLVKGVVFSEEDIPLQGVTLSVVGMSEHTLSSENGVFEIRVSPYARKLKASIEGYISQTAEIDGSYLVFKLKVDKEYAANKAKAEEEARIAAEKEAAAKAKAEEEARIAAEKEAAAKAKAEEEARIAAEREAAAKAKAEERARIAAERDAAAKAKAEEQSQIVAKGKQTPEHTVGEDELDTQLTTEKKATAQKWAEKDQKLITQMGVDFKSGYYSFVELGTIVDFAENPFDFSYIGGYYHHPNRLFVGAGIGYTSGKHSTYSYTREIEGISLTLNGKRYITNGLLRPFVELSVGLEFSDTHSEFESYDQTSFILSPKVGITLPIHKTMGVYATVGYHYNTRECYGSHPFHSGMSLNIGLTF